MRGVAIALVVIGAIFQNGRITGGVDVCLAITGFLGATTLADKIRDPAAITRRLARSARRFVIPLIPLLLLVLLLIPHAIPTARQSLTAREVRAGALMAENLHLLVTGAGYEPPSMDASPLQHLWATSVQAQFLLLMTAIALMLSFAARTVEIHERTVLIGLLAILSGLSLTWACLGVAAGDPAVYFSTLARLWELTIPALLGLLIPFIRLSPTLRAILSWAGLALVLGGVFLGAGPSTIPAPQGAAGPILGICLFLIAGETRTSWGADRLIAAPPLRLLGDISYSLYLWHWPILVVALTAIGRHGASVNQGIGILAAVLLAGVAGHALFENHPSHLWVFTRPYLPLGIATCSAALVALTATGAVDVANRAAEARWQALNLQIEEEAEEEDRGDYPGSAVLQGAAIPALAPIHPIPRVRELDTSWHYKLNDRDQCIQRGAHSDVLICRHPHLSYGPLVVMVGDSRTGLWGQAFAEIAGEHHWNLIIMERRNCPFTADARGNAGGPDYGEPCRRWNDEVLADLIELRPLLVITQATRRTLEGESSTVEEFTPGMYEAIEELNSAGIHTLLMREATTADKEMADCVDEEREDLLQCSEDRSHFYDPSFDNIAPEDLDLDPEFAHIFDTSRYLCDDKTCFAELGNVRIHYDAVHLSGTITQTIAPYIDFELESFVPVLYR